MHLICHVTSLQKFKKKIKNKKFLTITNFKFHFPSNSNCKVFSRFPFDFWNPSHRIPQSQAKRSRNHSRTRSTSAPAPLGIHLSGLQNFDCLDRVDHSGFLHHLFYSPINDLLRANSGLLPFLSLLPFIRRSNSLLAYW
ncbi:hypothetical protein Patl1_15793 [Pistacia atlantica]|uniref:Uncharacterized protein n=1 Tax=Pistacia atlantica TaxID=434234 RepID=A0ACC1BAX9_9ROSI|nr:hypothetical protein Patl1_15793 [Pistacia atlantica]